jgi:type I restriction enzyme, S subunit
MINKNELPKYWEVRMLGEVCEKVQVVRRKEMNPNDELIYLDIGGIDNTINKIVSHKTYIWKDAPSRAQQIVKKHDVLFSTVRTYLKNIASVDNDKYNGQIASSGFTVIRGSKSLNHKFVFYYSLSNIFLQPLNELQTGSSYPAVRDKDVFSQPLPLPPLAEQERIVAKIEELFSELDAGIASLKTAQAQLKTYRQAVLKYAFEGKLTNDKVNEGELPNGWKLGMLGDLSEMCLGKMLDRDKNKGEYQPYLRNINVRWGSFRLHDLDQMRFEPDESERFGVKKDDLIVCEGGEPGRCAIWNENNPNMKIQKALHRIRVNKELSVRYLFHYLYFSAKSGLLEKYFTGTTIKHLTGRELKKIEFPLCSLEEQQRIVEEIESRLSVCDKLEETIAASLNGSEALRQSILKKAFEGKLVSIVKQEENFA